MQLKITQVIKQLTEIYQQHDKVDFGVQFWGGGNKEYAPTDQNLKLKLMQDPFGFVVIHTRYDETEIKTICDTCINSINNICKISNNPIIIDKRVCGIGYEKREEMEL